jgi:dTDP-4-dehydrorhamnose reductase
MAQRIVIAGAGGQVGSVLKAEATRQGREVLALTSSQWDIADPQRAGEIVQAGDLVINCAAYTAVDAAEHDRDRAHAVNAAGPGYIAQACARVGARMVHISTDYVFDGAASRPYEPSDPARPLSVYGQTKLAGEQAVLGALPQAVVVRTAWVYTGGNGKDFVAAMRRLAAGEGTVDMVDDQTGSPTYTGDLVAALLEVADGKVHPPNGVVHAANEGEVTRFGQARAVFEILGADPERVRPVTSAHNPRPAARPAYSALSARQSQEAGLSPLRPWREALVAALSVPLDS